MIVISVTIAKLAAVMDDGVDGDHADYDDGDSDCDVGGGAC